MGNLCCRKKKERKKIVLLLLGLDNAGKTVAVKNLAGETIDSVVPTVGFSVVTLRHLKFDIRVYDLGGRPDFRDIWDRYYVDAHGIIFVVDSSDYERLNEAQEVLTNLISHEKVRGKPLLLLANKQDNLNALDEIDLIEKLQLEALVNCYECPTLVESCSATHIMPKSKLDPGIRKGYNWLINYIIREYSTISERVDTDVQYQEEVNRNEREAKIKRLKFLMEKDTNEEILDSCSEHKKQSNGLPLSDVFIIRNNKNKHSDSDSSQSTDSIPHVYFGTIQQEVIPSDRPASATSAVRQQLELKKLHKESFSIAANKTTPIHLYGVKQPKSAGDRRPINRNIQDRRNLKSAGDSIFVVSTFPTISLPVNDGSGDLAGFSIRNSKMSKSVLPPVDISKHKLQNGIHESTFDKHI